jgi:pyruvate ferredoxin oxidoreductase alpha subunit
LAFSSNELCYAPTIIEGYSYSYFKYQIHLASLKAREVFDEACVNFEGSFGRRYGPVEKFMMDDARYAFVSMGAYTTILKGAVMRLRRKGHKVGVLKLTLFRPFPKREIMEALDGLDGVAVFDQNLAPGRGGIIYPEIVESLYHSNKRPRAVVSFVGGLGGKELSYSEIEYMLECTMRYAEKGESPDYSILLYTDNDLTRLYRDMEIAGKRKGMR